MTTLVLLPGMDGTGELFESFRSALGEEFKAVIVVRYPVSEPMGYDELRKFVRSALPEDGSLVLLGESFSGPLAVMLAASELASRVRALVLCCTFVRNPRAWASRWRWLVDVLPIRGAPGFVLDRLLLGRYATPALRASLQGAVARVSPAVLRARLRAILDVDVSKDLAIIQAPTLYVRARHDRLVPSSAGDHIARLGRKVRLVDLDGPHALLQARPVQAARLVAEFVAEMKETSPT